MVTGSTHYFNANIALQDTSNTANHDSEFESDCNIPLMFWLDKTVALLRNCIIVCLYLSQIYLEMQTRQKFKSSKPKSTPNVFLLIRRISPPFQTRDGAR